MTVVDDLYIQNLEEYVLDENKLVTYKWLSKTLEVHVNQAKQMLYTFVQGERNKKDNDQLNVTYFVSGVAEINGVKTLQNQIVPEERLEVTRSRLHPVTSCHIYSVHKAKVKDSNALYMSDLDLVRDQLMQANKFSAIKCTSAKLRSTAELSKLKTVAQPTTNAPSFAKTNTQPSSNSTAQTTKGSKKPASGIAGMFATAEKKKDEKQQSKPPSPVKSNGVHKTQDEKAAPKPSKAKQGGIGNFFGSQATKPKKATEQTESNKPDEVTLKPAEPEIKKRDKSPQKPKVLPEKAKSPSPQPPSKSRRKNREDSDDENAQQKKRRRIKAAAWSDSSEEEDEEEEMEIEAPPPSPPPPSPPVAREPSPSPQKKSSPSPVKNRSLESEQNSSLKSSGSSTKRRKRQKKMVSKTFIDDGGFMVTEKVFESCSESASDEDPIPPTPPVKPTRQPASKNNQDKKSPSKKSPGASTAPGKQSTLMSFFKKK